MKVYLKTEDEIELMRQANQLVGKTLAELAKHIVPGVTTLQLDRIADEFIRDHGAIPTFKNFPNPFGGPFPASICTSVNETEILFLLIVAHFLLGIMVTVVIHFVSEKWLKMSEISSLWHKSRSILPSRLPLLAIILAI